MRRHIRHVAQKARNLANPVSTYLLHRIGRMLESYFHRELGPIKAINKRRKEMASSHLSPDLRLV